MISHKEQGLWSGNRQRVPSPSTLSLLLLPILFVSTLGFEARGASVEVPLFRSEFENADIVGIEVIGRELFAFGTGGSQPSRLRLEPGELVVFSSAQGRLGLVLTDRRALATSTRTGWSEVRYGAQEDRPQTALLEDRVAVLITDRRVLGFAAESSSWVETGLGPQERVGAVRIASGTAVVVTGRRAIGLSPTAGDFLVTPLGSSERVLNVGVRDNLATITTSRRLLVFSAPAATWTSQARALR